MQTSQLDIIVRQKDPALLKAVQHLANNETREGIALLVAATATGEAIWFSIFRRDLAVFSRCMVTSLAALLLAFILEPLVSSLDRIGIRRDVGALSSVVLVADCQPLRATLSSRALLSLHDSEPVRIVLLGFQLPVAKADSSRDSGRSDLSTRNLRRRWSDKGTSSGHWFYSFSRLLHAHLQTTRTLSHRKAIPQRTSNGCLSEPCHYIGDDSQLHRWKSYCWCDQRKCKCHRILVSRHSIFLFSCNDQRLP